MKTVAFIGLLLNTIGTGLVWRFGLPQDVRRQGQFYLMVEGENEAEKKKAKRFDLLSNIGMAFICAGFVLQAAATYYL